MHTCRNTQTQFLNLNVCVSVPRWPLPGVADLCNFLLCVVDLIMMPHASDVYIGRLEYWFDMSNYVVHL